MTLEDMEDLLDRLGIEVVSTRGSEVQGFCPAHLARTGHVDHNPSWWINSDTGAHICFSCQFKGSVQSLIAFMQGIDFESASTWLKSSDTDLAKKLERLMSKEVAVEPEPNLNPITEANLAAFVDPPIEMLRSRGILPNVAKEYGVLWDTFIQSWILPIREPITGALLGWQAKGGTDRYFRNFPNGVQKSTALFGYQQYSGGDMIVVESPLDVVRLASVGITGGVATYGSVVSKAQVNYIRGADSIIVAMDNDEAGKKASEYFLELSDSMGFECKFFDYSGTDAKDIGGMSKVEIVNGLNYAKHSVHGRKAFL